MKLFALKEGQTLLNVVSGTGYFSRCFNQLGMQVTGLDPDAAMIKYAKEKKSSITFIEGDALTLPFADNAFDYCSAITSLCFVTEPEKAIAEILRVSRYGIMLGLLNRDSLLYYQKKHSRSYAEARWDTVSEVNQWNDNLKSNVKMTTKSAVWIPSGGIIARTLESLLPNYLPYGSFLAIALRK